MNGSESWLAWDRWIKSDEGKKASDPGTLGPTSHEHARTYLANRLSAAFFAGMRAEEDYEKGRSK
jgi:hypothetical protein